MTRRTDKVDSLLVREVSAILSKDIEPPEGCLITVMRAEVAPDLKQATIFVSILPEQQTDKALRLLKRLTKDVQQILNRKLFMKFVPHISWEVDLTNVKYAEIDEALKG